MRNGLHGRSRFGRHGRGIETLKLETSIECNTYPDVGARGDADVSLPLALSMTRVGGGETAVRGTDLHSGEHRRPRPHHRLLANFVLIPGVSAKSSAYRISFIRTLSFD